MCDDKKNVYMVLVGKSEDTAWKNLSRDWRTLLVKDMSKKSDGKMSTQSYGTS